MTRRWIIATAFLALSCAAAPAAAAGSDARPVRAGDKAGGKASDRAIDKATAPVNINEASKTQLMSLAGVGASTAERIIAHRTANGPFKRPQDLEKVEGVGKTVLERNAGRIVVK